MSCACGSVREIANGFLRRQGRRAAHIPRRAAVDADAAAVLTMNEMMGIVGEGPLPAQVQELVVTTGVVVTITPSTAAAAAPAAATAAAPAMPRSASSGKRKADDACGWVLLKEG